jgi:hypothetical protein
MSAPVEIASCHNGFVAACQYTAHDCARLLLWRPVNSTAKKSSMDGNNSSSVMAALRPEKADFTVSLPAQAQGTLRGIDIKALPLE